MVAPLRRQDLASLRAELWPGLRGFGCRAARIAGFVPVIFVCLVMALAYFTAVPGVLVPMLSVHPGFAAALLVLFNFVYLNVVINFGLLVFADPGSVPDDWKAPVPSYMANGVDTAHDRGNTAEDPDDMMDLDVEEQLTLQKHPLLSRRVEASSYPGSRTAPSPTFPHFHLMLERTHNGLYRYCRTCKQYKSDRTHHCRMCGRCILRMDHHCVFINNCVGFLNHKFFVSFVIYAFIGCMFVTVVAFPEFLKAVGEAAEPLASSGRHQVPAQHMQEAANHRSTAFTAVLVIGYIVDSAFSFALAAFVVFHIYLVLKGRTTIEMCDIVDASRSASIKQYDLGARANCRAVFGTVPLCWFFPTRYGIEGDGLWYERSTDGEIESYPDLLLPDRV